MRPPSLRTQQVTASRVFTCLGNARTNATRTRSASTCSSGRGCCRCRRSMKKRPS
ncbi:hypothetical protein Goari_018264 [Gossypium aridum]|uniref:Uncharacterized protein n=1 Tax=Gossypium aridum TaxID=34290 RepID=A0A7J8WP57_GOSAI|nr:hypothetical protein [Gossypium aridum]